MATTFDKRSVFEFGANPPIGPNQPQWGRLLIRICAGLVFVMAAMAIEISQAVAADSENRSTGEAGTAVAQQAANPAVEAAPKPAVEPGANEFDEALATIRAITMSRGIPHPEVGKNFRGSREGGLLFLLQGQAALKEAGVTDEALKMLPWATFRFRRVKDLAALKLQRTNLDFNEKELSQEELSKRRIELLDEYFDEVQALEKEHLPELKKLLAEDQFARLQQISLQAFGSWDLAADPELGKTLELTPDQVARITAINQEYRRKELEIYFKRPPLRIYERLAMDKERDKKAIDCLTLEQQDKYKSLIGKPFKLALLSMPEAWGKTEEPFGGGRQSASPFSTLQNQGIINLISNPLVQKELGLSDDLVASTGAVKDRFTAAWGEAGGRVRPGVRVRADGKSVNHREAIAPGSNGFPGNGGSDVEFNQEIAKQRELWNTLSAKYVLQLKEVLSADQFTRLQQIHWQVSGVEAFTDPDLVQTLAVTKEQENKIVDAMNEWRIEQRQLFGRRIDQTAGEKMAESVKQRDLKINQLMTREQLDQFTAMKGKPFPFPVMSGAGPPQRIFSSGLRGGIFSIVRNAAVQEELQMSQDTEIDVEMIKEQFSAAWHEAGGGFRFRSVSSPRGVNVFQEPAIPPFGLRMTVGQSREELDKTIVRMTDLWHSITETHQAKLKEVLTPEQYSRLKQIFWQAMGASAYSDPEVIALLALTKDQQDKLITLNNEFQRKNQELISQGAGTGGGVAERNSKLQELSTKLKELAQEHEAQINQVITQAQLDQFAAIKGKDFDVSQLLEAEQPNGPMRGQGGGRGGRANSP